MEDDEFPDAFENGAAVEDRLGDGGEIVVEDDDIAGLLGHLGAAAHGKPHVRLFEGGGVVDAVPRHAGHQAHLLGQADEAAFVRGHGAGDHPQGGQPGFDLAVCQVFELTARHNGFGRAVRLEKAGRAGDRGGGFPVVPRHHHHLDPGLVHLGDGAARFGAHLVPDADEPDEDEAGEAALLRYGGFGNRQGENPHGMPGHLRPGGTQQHAAVKLAQGTLVVDVPVAGTQQLFGCAFDEGDPPHTRAVDSPQEPGVRVAAGGDFGGGPFPGAVKGDAGGDRIAVREGLPPENVAHQGPVGGVAADHLSRRWQAFVVVIAGQAGHLPQDLFPSQIGRIPALPSAAVDKPGDLQPSPGQGAGLVGE